MTTYIVQKWAIIEVEVEAESPAKAAEIVDCMAIDGELKADGYYPTWEMSDCMSTDVYDQDMNELEY